MLYKYIYIILYIQESKRLKEHYSQRDSIVVNNIKFNKYVNFIWWTSVLVYNTNGDYTLYKKKNILL